MAAYFVIQAVKTDRIIIHVYGLSDGDTVRVFCRLQSDDNDESWNKVGRYTLDEESDYYREIIYDLTPATAYYVNVMVNDSGTWLGRQEATTSGTQARFAWSHEKVKGEAFNLTADEWNDLCDFVNQKSGRNNSFTAAVRDATFTAAMYNEVVEAIGEGTEVEKGDIITADLLNELVANANNM